MTQTIIPNKEWYIKESKKAGVPPRCPYAHHRKCPRYWETTSLLKQAGVIAGLSEEEDKNTYTFWKSNMMLAELAEDMVTLNQGQHGGVDGMFRACPEVASKFIHLYADTFYKYVDDTDRITGHQIMEQEGLKNSWRSRWMHLSPKHYLDCEVFESAKGFNEQNTQSFVDTYHKNIKMLLDRMDRGIDAKDVGAVIGTAGLLIEALAKVVSSHPRKETKTFGSLKSDFENSSNLTPGMKELCHELYILRNKEPNAGHGRLDPSNCTFDEAIFIAAITKAIIEIEYRYLDE
ncbi:MAG: hypothetical protein CMG93_07680 [Marinomonas sp.]|nr:hypothetical protein [Marinomonas sp.]RUM54951.1 MAG: hypothetical protein DSY85_06215 [Marinomonas sp.]